MRMQANSRSEKIAVFGFKDTLVGQTLEMLKAEQAYEVAYFIAVNGVPEIDIKSEHLKRPNRKTEFVEDGTIFGAPVFSTQDYIHKLTLDGIKKVLVLEDTGQQRSEIFRSLLEANIEPISYIHPTTVFGGQNTIGKGVVILPNCYIGYKADIGDGTIIQSSCVIEHHSSVGRFCDINPRLTTGGCTYIGDFVEINISVDIINRIRIEAGARVGAGSLVLRDCERNFLYYGRPARKVRPNIISNCTNS